MSGWYIMHRGWMDSFKPEPFTEREAFLWSIEQAAIKDHDQWFNGRKIPVARGEFVTSLRLMAEAFSWSVKRVRGLMERLGKEQKWAQRQAHQGAQSPTIITVCNYVKYQDKLIAQGTATGTVEGTSGAQSGHSEGTQQNKGNKGNNGKEEESPSDSSIGEPTDRRELALVQTVPQLFDANEIGPAFEAYQALRLELKPGARSIELTSSRRAKLAARLRDVRPRGGWAVVLAKIRGSPFLRGETSRDGKFVAEIDWLLEPRNLLKVMDGNYDPTDTTAQPGAGHRPNSPMSAMRTARSRLGLG